MTKKPEGPALRELREYGSALFLVPVVIFIALLLLTACAGEPTRFVPEPVSVPINNNVYCDSPLPAEPPWAAMPNRVEPGSDVWTQSQAFRAEINQREAYELQLKGVIEGCRKPAASPTTGG